MPPELVRAQVLRALCQQWGYTPEEALRAPVWVLRASNLLAIDAELTRQAG